MRFQNAILADLTSSSRAPVDSGTREDDFVRNEGLYLGWPRIQRWRRNRLIEANLDPGRRQIDSILVPLNRFWRTRKSVTVLYV